MKAGPVHSGPVQSLKISVGLLGRADFFTAPNKVGADLVWWDERVAVWVMSCVWHGCPTHGSEAVPAWRDRIREKINIDMKVEGALREMGWLVLRFFECKVAEDPRAVGEQILAALGRHAVKVPEAVADELQGTMMGWARLARIDAIGRSSDKHWFEFLKVIRESGARFRKMDIQAYLVAECGWPEEVFQQVWRTAQHHDVVDYTPNGAGRGEIFDAVIEDAGLTT